MRTKLWMLGVAVAALTSCTQSEVMDIAQGTNIEFDSFLGKQSRADYSNVAAQQLQGAAGATNDLTNFWVYGYYDGEASTNVVPFNGTEVFWDNTNSTFKYDVPQQWHVGDYQFAAYSNGNNELTASNAVSFSLIDKTFTFTDYINDGNNDLVAAIPALIEKTEDNIASGEAVKFNFKHMLSCIELRFTNASAAFALDFKDVKFSAKSKGTCIFSGTNTPSINWTNQDSMKEYEFKTNIYEPEGGQYTDPSVLLQPGGSASLYCFVIPQTNSSIELTFNVDSYNRITTGTDSSGKPTYSYSFSSPNSYEASLSVPSQASWQPGILYRYTADVIGMNHYINFSVQSIEGWTSPNNPAVETPMNPATPTPANP